MAIAAFLSLISHFGKSVLTFLTGTTWPFLKKNWRQVSWWVFFIWAILCLLSHCTGVINPFGKSGSGDTTVTVKRAQLDDKEEELNQIIKDYQDTIRLKDLRIDSFDIAIHLKNKQLKNIHHEVQLLSGDSLAIVAALNGVFSKKR